MKNHVLCTAVGVGLLYAVTVSPALWGAVIHVPANQPTIQAAVDVAVNGDTVMIATGTFSSNGNRDIVFGGRAISVRGQGADQTIIDCGGTAQEHHGAFVFNAGDTGIIIAKLEITGAYFQMGGHDSGAITCLGGSPTIRESRIWKNRSHGVAVIGASSPFLLGLEISSNEGWGISMPGYPYLSVGVIVGYCQIDHNKLGGMVLTRALDTTYIQANTIADNGGDGLFLQGDLPKKSSGFSISAYTDVSRNVIAFNSGSGINFTGFYPGVQYRRNVIFGNQEGNILGSLPDTMCIIYADPLFCRNAAAQEYAVMDSSPCFNNHCGQLIGVTPFSCTTCCVGHPGNVDCDPQSQIDIADLTRLIDYLYVSFIPLCCVDGANMDGSGSVDIADLTALIDYLYVSLIAPPNCFGG